MANTGLLATGQLTADAVREADFPVAVFGGYKADAVNRFLGRVATELDKLGAALDERASERERMTGDLKRLQDRLSAARSGPQAASQPDPGPQAARILQRAQGNADAMLTDATQRAHQIVDGARHEHDQIIAHARQQAGAVLAEASQRASAERDRIVGSATAEARRQVAYYTALGHAAGSGLRAELETIFRMLADWDAQAHAGAAQAMAGAPA